MDYAPKRITLRIPALLHKKLMEVADESSKSMNAEVIARLQESFDKPNSDNSDLADLIRSIIREELSKK